MQWPSFESDHPRVTHCTSIWYCSKMSGLGSLSSSSRSRDCSPIPIQFPTGRWDSGPMFEWYHQADTLRRINKLQIRIDTSGAIPHRFIIAYASDETEDRKSIYRFDRRPDSKAVFVINAALRDADSGIAKDECTPGVDPSTFETTQCEVELTFGRHADLMEIIKACHGMSQDEQAKNYTLRRYNCFFFSWTILLLVARRHLPFEKPTPDIVLRHFESHISRLTDYAVEEVVKLLLELVIDTIATFRQRDNSALVAGMSTMERALWGLPTRVIQSFWRKSFQIHLHLGFRDHLKKHIGAVLRTRAAVLCPEVLGNYLTDEHLDKQLWLEGISDIVRPALESEVAKVLCDGVLEALVGDLEKDSSKPIESKEKLKFSLFGKTMAQLIAAWNAALPAGLVAGHHAAYGQSRSGQVPNEELFDLIWNGARKATLVTVQGVVERTKWQVKDQKKQAKIWSAVWDMWDECWEATHSCVRPKAMDVLDKVVEELIGAGVATAIETMQQSGSATVEARVINQVSLSNGYN